MYQSNKNDAMALAPNAQLQSYGTYNSNVPMKTFAGEPVSATESDLRRLAGYVQKLSGDVKECCDKPHIKPAPVPTPGPGIYYDGKQCVVSSTPLNATQFGSMTQCLSVHPPVV